LLVAPPLFNRLWLSQKHYAEQYVDAKNNLYSKTSKRDSSDGNGTITETRRGTEAEESKHATCDNNSCYSRGCGSWDLHLHHEADRRNWDTRIDLGYLRQLFTSPINQLRI